MRTRSKLEVFLISCRRINAPCELHTRSLGGCWCEKLVARLDVTFVTHVARRERIVRTQDRKKPTTSSCEGRTGGTGKSREDRVGEHARKGTQERCWTKRKHHLPYPQYCRSVIVLPFPRSRAPSDSVERTSISGGLRSSSSSRRWMSTSCTRDRTLPAPSHISSSNAPYLASVKRDFGFFERGWGRVDEQVTGVGAWSSED